MNCFQIIKSVLDEAYNEIPDDDVNKDLLIKDTLEYLRGEYRRLQAGNDIDYSEPVTRFAYIYNYVTSHANIVYSIIKSSPSLEQLFERDKINASCIGGGPGSDFLGILKYLMIHEKQPNIKFLLCDREKAWADSWFDIDDKVDPDFRISTQYLNLDVTKPQDYLSQQKYLKSDFFTMIYFMSELFSLKESAHEYFQHLFSKASKDAWFLFVDNNNSDFYGWFDELADKYGIKIIESKETNIQLPYNEEKRDLGEYFEKFSSPKIKANVAYRIACKC